MITMNVRRWDSDDSLIKDCQKWRHIRQKDWKDVVREREVAENVTKRLMKGNYIRLEDMANIVKYYKRFLIKPAKCRRHFNKVVRV
jgi:hypothetical protein